MGWGGGMGLECQIQPLTLTTMATTIGTWIEKDPDFSEAILFSVFLPALIYTIAGKGSRLPACWMKKLRLHTSHLFTVTQL